MITYRERAAYKIFAFVRVYDGWMMNEKRFRRKRWTPD
jgi:hypothetical protein